MANRAIVQQYLSQGKQLTLLKGKRPLMKDWTKARVSEEKILSHDDNIGWVVGASDLVIDVDPKNGGEDSFEKLLEFLRINDSAVELDSTVNTPSGGFHIYLALPKKCAGKKFKKTLNKSYPGIDFLTQGSQCVIAGSETERGKYQWSDDMLGEFEQALAPLGLIRLLSSDSDSDSELGDSELGDSELGESELGDFEGLIEGGTSGWTQDAVESMMAKLDPSMGNDDWVKVGMALHDWSPTGGLDVWEQWSKQGENYKEGETETRWESFTAGGGVTLGTVSHMVKEVDYDESVEKVNGYVELIKSYDEKRLEFDLLPTLKEESFSGVGKEKLVKAIQDRYKALSGIRMPIANIRQMITPVDIVTGTFVADGETPAWCKNWAYVNTHTGFISLVTLRLHKSESFNIENGKHVPTNEGGNKPSAAKYVSDWGFVDKVDCMAYLPFREEGVFTMGGESVLNSFNPRSVPVEAQEFTDDGKKAIDKIKKHIKLVCTTDETANILTQWLAHQVQHPGRQVLWAPVVQSIQGLGKTFFGELLRACLGDRNVGTVSPNQVVSEFNGWATNVVVNMLEELRVKGHNRYEVVNALKPLISDRIIQINDKGVKHHMIYNTTNYMCFTNYKDSLPLDEDDRRWWVIFAPIQSLKDLRQFVGEDVVSYFPKLFEAIQKNGQEVRKWLLEYEISADFMNTKQAPMTQDKLSMIATEDASFEGLFEIKELIKIGGKYFNEEAISSVDLFDALLFKHPELEVQTTKRNILLKKLGYMILPKPINVDGKARRIWSKTQIPNKEVRALLLQQSSDVDDL